MSEGKKEILLGDCLELLPKIESNTVDLVVIDPPYNINIDEWDNLGTVNEYLNWFENVVDELVRITRKNGSIYIFGDFRYIADIKVMMNKKDVGLTSWIIWDKGSKAQNSTRSYVNISEHCLFFVKGIKKDLNIPTEINTVREYLRAEKKKSGVTNKEFNLMFSDFYKKEGCKDRSVIEHYFSEMQWVFPSEEIYKEILQKTGYFQRDYFELKKEYKNLVFTFNADDIRVPRNQKDKRDFRNEKQLLTNVWYYNNKQEMTLYDHPTVKPIDMIRTIIKASSNKGDLVLDCFGGSGTTAIACLHEKRQFIVMEKEQKYYDIILKRVGDFNKNFEQQTLFGNEM
jgi:site-specific DNA-methyltransferase (adenine-specific)